ncbi:MoxR family ATPase [Kibdelosporangium persicum]|uniref:ATPase family protein associated with various cellular activities (AAA) n=1 Tax=Kibdelosporangium persicum TaxID=2698649 RepID=A0ABX2EXL2_9PSEU|nr:MoxR family ATPase [Kibdelosporangium persicum]NRN63433.1 ATPase family protein associated with various cellular activities (AAA) [Kibdelosporangium persicum]
MDWRIYRGTGQAAPSPITALPQPPPWRRFTGEGVASRPDADGGETARRIGGATGRRHLSSAHEVSMVNAALYLRRPLLVTGRPGTGKSSLAYLIAAELGLGPVLRWGITSRTTLTDGLYSYDAIGRVQAAGARPDREPDIGDFVHLGPLGTALLPYETPRVLLVDELDKGDIDLPNDLLSVFEDGEYPISELVRIAKQQPEVTVFTHDKRGTAVIRDGLVQCRAFPVVIITSNGEREFPAAFLRRCLQLHLRPPDAEQLAAMVAAQFGEIERVDVARLIGEFLERSESVGGLAADQLLNAVHLAVELATSGAYRPDEEWNELMRAIWHPLSTAEPG